MIDRSLLDGGAMAVEASKHIRVLADAPSKADFLGFRTSIAALKKIIASPETVTPFTIDVFGDWGMGKSTLMMQLASELRHDGLSTVFFNPWKYEGKEEVWKALVQTILLTFEEKEKQEVDRGYLEQILIGLARTATSTALKHVSGGLVDFDKFLKEYAQHSKENLRFINQFESTFTRLVRKYSGDRNLVIFIDDLDRCIPKNAISILEAIKLFLSVPRCIYVIGVERAIIQDGIRQRYGEKVNFSGKDYLEKIIQLPFSLPTPSADNITKFVEVVAGKNISETVRNIAIVGAESNPRRIKRFINSFNLLKAILLEEGDEALNETVLTFVLMTQIRFPEHYLHFGNNLPDFVELCRRITNGERFSADDLKRIGESRPRYAGLLQDPAFSLYLQNIERLGLNLVVGDEGAHVYFVATRAISLSPSESQEYYLPEIVAEGSIYRPESLGYSVVLAAAGDKKINVIKQVREVTGLGLKEAKDLVESAPQLVINGRSRADAEQVAKRLTDEGAKVEIR
jgi:ribosomal protein L7/L12